jgi:hypothetical protein
MSSDTNVSKKSTASHVSSEKDELILSGIDRNSLEAPGSDLINAPEYEAAFELSNIEADLQKPLRGISVCKCHEMQRECERILYEMYFRARRDAYHEVTALKAADAAK